MDPQPVSKDIPHANAGVAPELIQQLHDANEQFSQARQDVDAAMNAEVNGLEQRKHALDNIRSAEQELEKVDQRINQHLQEKQQQA